MSDYLKINTVEGVFVTGLIGTVLFVLTFIVLIFIEENVSTEVSVFMALIGIAILMTYIFKIGGHKMIMSLFMDDER